MPQDFSFDVVSKVELQAVDNAVNTANRELATRFDFKGSVSRLEWDKKNNAITVFSDNDFKLKSVIDVLQSRFVKQNISLKSLDFQKVEPAESGTVRQSAKIIQGISSDKAKEMVRAIKDKKYKVTPSIQGDQLRVSGRSKDDLQSVISFLRAKDFGLSLQFTNFK